MHWFRLGVLVIPAALLICGSLRNEGQAQIILWLGGLFQVLIVSLLLLSRRAWDSSIRSSAIIVYIIAIAWLWMGDSSPPDWFSHLTQFLLLVVPLLLFALQTLTESGAMTTRRARLLAQRLAARTDWPSELAECKNLPEVKALREALTGDASPALALLQHPRTQVRVAALAALEFRTHWRVGQAQMVLKLARSSREPAVRAAAVSALANLEDRALVEQLVEFLRDEAPGVRKAANEAMLWDTEKRWAWIRHGVRLALADPMLQPDGPLRFDGIVLKDEALKDLTAWAAEKGSLGVRAALTLAAHYGRLLNEQPGSALVRHLKQQLANAQAAPTLRVELAQLLKNSGELDRPMLEEMVDAVNPAPLRLIAADVLLANNHDPGFPHLRALQALRDISRLPNREMALTAADVVQRRLGVDMGLALGQPLPPLHSRLAADVTRRLMQWAAAQDGIPRQEERETKVETEEEKPRHPDRGSGVFGIGGSGKR
jgi:hypothetical protein